MSQGLRVSITSALMVAMLLLGAFSTVPSAEASDLGCKECTLSAGVAICIPASDPFFSFRICMATTRCHGGTCFETCSLSSFCFVA